MVSASAVTNEKIEGKKKKNKYWKGRKKIVLIHI
jgi:hypothetical protein